MNNLSKFIAASALAVSGVSQAGIVSLPGGVVFNEILSGGVGAGTFETSLVFSQHFETKVGAIDTSIDMFDFSINPGTNTIDKYSLHGVGELAVQNHYNSGGVEAALLAANLGVPVCASCELTFEFTNLGLTGNDLNSNGNYDFGEISLDVTGAELKIYVDSNIGADAFDINQLVALDVLNTSQEGFASDGTLWLALDFIESDFDPDVTPLNEGFSGLQSGDASFGFETKTTGDPLIDGIAAVAFNTNAVNFPAELSMAFHDAIAFGLSATFAHVNGATNTYSIESAGTFQAAPVVSEPTTLAILGLGLLGLSGAARRKRV